ncbi:hypothetical protein, partial [Sedimenticola selenatireducens]|uniref:hypothetical protein n=1 Tax=Sedimenticola selenatireducens TaxID=191960 RepID=UPI001B80D077
SGPVVGAGAGLHRHTAWGVLGKVAQQLLTTELLAPLLLTCTVQCYHKKRILCQIQTDCHKLFHGLLLHL